MIPVTYGRTVQWQDERGGWHVGRTVRKPNGNLLCIRTPLRGHMMLLREVPSGNEVWVSVSVDLFPYPASKIEQPGEVVS